MEEVSQEEDWVKAAVQIGMKRLEVEQSCFDHSHRRGYHFLRRRSEHEVKLLCGWVVREDARQARDMGLPCQSIASSHLPLKAVASVFLMSGHSLCIFPLYENAVHI